MAAAATGDFTAEIARSARAEFESFVRARTPLFPTVRERMAADPWHASWWLQPARWLSLGDFDTRDRRFIFLTARHPELLESFRGDEALVVGGPADRSAARRLGLPSCLQADLYLAARDVLFHGRDRAATRILARWRALLSRQADPCYLLVSNDTSPISLLLVTIAATCPNLRSVCLQHGLFNAGYDQDDIEGRNSDFNLVYDAHQRQEMLRRLPRARVGVMGYPAELPATPPHPEAHPRVVLVGTGVVEQPESYAMSLQRFAAAATSLRAAGFRPEYRPHPVERTPVPWPTAGEDLPVQREAKHTLLGGARKAFVGFTSTLLYEAHCFGHLVVVLDDPKLPGYALSSFGERLGADRLDDLPALLSANYASMGLPACGGLRARFEAGLREAESSGGSGRQPLSLGLASHAGPPWS